jgi:hypothetical protein
MDTDTQFKTSTIEQVGSTDSGWIVKSDGFSLLVPSDLCQQAPTAGETARFYGRGIGYPVRGIVIEGRVYRYQTEEEEKQAHTTWVADRAREKHEALERDRAERDRRIAALPEAFRARFARFHAVGGDDWRADFEPYELFTCEEAVTIHAALETRKAIAGFSRATVHHQKELVPALKYGDHSGNTFGQACQLAALMADGGENIAKMHGALCPLVGCQAYGCWAAHEGTREA